MIEYVRGRLSSLSPAVAIVDVGGVGYALNITLSTHAALKGQSEVCLYVHEHLVTGGRDDGLTLYGFATVAERSLYRLLLTVNGVGAGTARVILSSIAPADLCHAITSGDERALRSVKGIGPKAAQRMLLELRDPLLSAPFAEEYVSSSSPEMPSTPFDPEVRAAAIGALTILGFSPAPSARVVEVLLREDPSLSVEAVVKLSLKKL